MRERKKTTVNFLIRLQISFFRLKQKLSSDRAVKFAAVLHSPNTTMNPNYLPATSATAPSYTQIGRRQIFNC